MGTGQMWNPSMYSDPLFDEKIRELHLMRDEGERRKLARSMTIEMMDQAIYLWLPIRRIYQAWWPWVKNYGGELEVGGARPGPVFARIWIDHKLKEQMGF